MTPRVPEGASDADAKKTMDGVYQGGVDRLRSQASGDFCSSGTTKCSSRRLAANRRDFRQQRNI
jgi:hypothetical protein